MSRHFRPWTIDQTQLLPAAVVDYVPADHLAQFVVALAREHLDLSEIVASYKSGLGQPPFDPRMMTALLLYAYCSGLYSSRRIAKACSERVDFMMIVAHDAPDFRTIRRLQETSSAAAGEAVFAGAEAGGKSRAGEAGACRARRHEDQGERLQTQGDELRTHENA
jgi:transposase